MGVEVAVRIYLVFECAIVRAGLESVIEDVPDVRVVGGCRDFENAAEQLQGLECDVVIADVSPPGMPLARFVERLAYFESPPRVLILPSHGRHHHIEELLRSGVRGFLDATASRDDLGSAIDAVANGRFFVSEDIAQNMMHGIATGAPQQESSLDKLSNRERQTLALVVEGLSSKEIASQLGLSTRTIETYRQAAMSKLHLHKTADLVRFAIREGLAAF